VAHGERVPLRELARRVAGGTVAPRRRSACTQVAHEATGVDQMDIRKDAFLAAIVALGLGATACSSDAPEEETPAEETTTGAEEPAPAPAPEEPAPAPMAEEPVAEEEYAPVTE